MGATARPDAYGEAFADVYDRWYGDATDAEATADFVAGRCGGGPVIELGVGTGRLAVPLVERGLAVIGVDTSASMLAHCVDRQAGPDLWLVQADMTQLPLRSAATGALIGFNTLFNVTTVVGQRRVFEQLGSALTPGGLVIVEALDLAVLAHCDGTSIGVKAVHRDGVTVVATAVDVDRQIITGQHVDLNQDGFDLRPWTLRWATVTEIDDYAAASGFELIERYGHWDQRPFHAGDDRHVSVYRRSTAPGLSGPGTA